MQRLTETLPYAVVTKPCGGCTNSSSKCGCNYARYNGMSVTLEVCNNPVSTTIYNPYQTNMTLCNQNFNRVETITTDLKSQILRLNQQITELRGLLQRTNVSIDGLNTSVTGLGNTVQTHNTTITQVQTQIQTNQNELRVQIEHMNTQLHSTTESLDTTHQQVITLTRKIETILTFLPRFVRATTHWFVQLMTGLRTNSVENVPEFICDTTPLTITDV